jgi:hypothetical protein
MRAHVVKDTGTREIELAVEGLPDLDVTESWHRKPRFIRPDKASVRLVNGQTRSIIINGYLIKASGQPSDSVRDKRVFVPNGYRTTEHLANAPGWVRELFAQAPTGIAEFTWASAEEAMVL